jgi:hypothetical protein
MRDDNMNFRDVADDFMVNLNLQTALALPTGRESILHFYEAVQRQFPSMATFFQREGGEAVLEGDREAGTYQWIEVLPHRLTAGYFNPPTLKKAYDFHNWLLERSTYFLGVSGLDVEVLDLLFGFNMDYLGNRDAIVAQALLEGSPLASLHAQGLHPLEFEPSMVVALDEGCFSQARVSIETRCGPHQVRTGEYDDEPISVYFTVRSTPQPGKLFVIKDVFAQECEWAEHLSEQVVVPSVINPIAAAIAAG